MKIAASLLILSGSGLLLAAAPGRGPVPATPASPPSATRPANSPIAPNARPIRLASGFAFTEGATSDKEGNVYFVDQPNNRIAKWTFDPDSDDPAKGKLETFMQPSGYANGMSFDHQGMLIVCADEKNELWSINPADKKVTVLIKDYQGRLLNGPNDLWIRPDGGMYITDPLYARNWWQGFRTSQMQQPGKYVYFLSPDHKTLTPVVTDLRTPNGVIGTPDGKTLYVSDMDGQQTFSYTIKDDGTLADKKLFCATGSDGMTIDSEGNVYTTHGRNGVMIWDKNGTLIERLNVGSSNVCFGGRNKDILFINTTREVWGLKMRTKGVGPA